MYVSLYMSMCAFEFLGSADPLDQLKQLPAFFLLGERVLAKRTTRSLITTYLCLRVIIGDVVSPRNTRALPFGRGRCTPWNEPLGSHVNPIHSTILFIHKNFFSTCARNLLRIFFIFITATAAVCRCAPLPYHYTFLRPIMFQPL